METKKIARVFPLKTSMSPDDKDAYFDMPGLFVPAYNEVHVSVTFSWDIPKAQWLAKQWERVAPVKIGGPAIDGESDQPFVAGMYLKRGVTITSRGCVNKCSFCTVRRQIIEFAEFPDGNIIQDNNILATSDFHWWKVIQMLKRQRAIEFKGGLEAARLTRDKVLDLCKLKIKTLWCACDSRSDVKVIERAGSLLQKYGFKRRQMFCYVLIGKDKGEELDRLITVWKAGFIPFAQLFKAKVPITYSREWRKFQKEWSRPAIIKSMMQGR